MTDSNNSRTLSSSRALRRFGFRQTLRGALIVGLLVGLMMGAQGAAFAAAYPDQHSRDTFAASLQAAPALGFMAGEVANISTPASYSIYKSIALTTIITAIWGLLVTTRLLRGQEEDGRWESLVAGTTTMRRASWHVLIGYGYSFGLACLLAFIGIAVLGTDPKVNLSPEHSALLVLGVFLPALFFACLGIVTSQLAITRQRAMLYGVVPLLLLYSIRGAANSVTDLNWLKQFSPFGWTDLLNPVLGPHTIWILPSILFASLFTILGIYLAGRRDLGASLIHESDVAPPHYFLLGSPLQLALRQHGAGFIWWTIGALTFTIMLAALTNISVSVLESSPAAASVIGKLGGSLNDLKIAFIGFSATFSALILLIMATVSLSAFRHDEAKGYLENLLVQPTKRSVWLVSRLALIISVVTLISTLCAYISWLIARTQGINLDLSIMLQGGIALIGTVVLTLGIGTALYGLFPRLAVIAMYIVIVWAFMVDILKSFFTLGDIITKSSLLYYISFSPTKAPDWTAFAWLVGIGTVLIVAGIVGFMRRDYISE